MMYIFTSSALKPLSISQLFKSPISRGWILYFWHLLTTVDDSPFGTCEFKITKLPLGGSSKIFSRAFDALLFIRSAWLITATLVSPDCAVWSKNWFNWRIGSTLMIPSSGSIHLKSGWAICRPSPFSPTNFADNSLTNKSCPQPEFPEIHRAWGSLDSSINRIRCVFKESIQ